MKKSKWSSLPVACIERKTTRNPSKTLLTSSLQIGMTTAVEARGGPSPSSIAAVTRQLSPPLLST